MRNNIPSGGDDSVPSPEKSPSIYDENLRGHERKPATKTTSENVGNPSIFPRVSPPFPGIEQADPGRAPFTPPARGVDRDARSFADDPCAALWGGRGAAARSTWASRSSAGHTKTDVVLTIPNDTTTIIVVQLIIKTSRILSYRQTKMYIRICLLYTSPSPRDQRGSRMPSSA